jgi:hypothetical protein
MSHSESYIKIKRMESSSVRGGGSTHVILSDPSWESPQQNSQPLPDTTSYPTSPPAGNPSIQQQSTSEAAVATLRVGEPQKLPPEIAGATGFAHSPRLAHSATQSHQPIAHASTITAIDIYHGWDAIDTCYQSSDGVVRDPTFVPPTTWDVESRLFGSCDLQHGEAPIPIAPHLRLCHGETSIPGLRLPRRSHKDVLAYFDAGWDRSQ